ncbi:unnamed protein product [Prorocentrum cordatum]|uniref:Uncharacterized protein n=1 Tax=Prorocentrum cordatum TaxID=2364126 RepID=A0ABN9W0R9_9DINO|nr:unnamed protein product [Polarella glacialis]
MVAWAAALWLLAALCLGALLAPLWSRLDEVRRKLALVAYGGLYLVLSRDGQFQLPPDPGKSSGSVCKTKTIVFVRHGESSWNECFNRGVGLGALLRVALALAQELAMLLSLDSLFFDSPLSREGLSQAEELRRFLECPDGSELRGLCGAAVLASSCLRRAACTGLLAFRWALGDGRPVWALSCLQEISRNVDTLTLCAAHRPPPLPAPLPGGPAPGSLPAGCLQAAYNFGNKGLAGNGGQRLEAFCEWAFSDCSPAALQPAVVVFGHSLWFRTFFQVFLPHAAYHECKHAKIVNCGVVAFELELLGGSESGRTEYRVRPGSVRTLYGGFEGSKQKRRQRCAEHQKQD